MSTTTNPVIGSTVTIGRTDIRIRTLAQDIQFVNEMNEFRLKNGLAKIRNALPWWKAVFVAATYFDNTFTFAEVRNLLAQADFHIAGTGATLLKNAATGQTPSHVYREYTNTLPAVAQLSKLEFVGTSAASSGRGRPTSVFKFKDAENARKWILATFPETAGLFATLDRTL